jgi:hypothetical protein
LNDSEKEEKQAFFRHKKRNKKKANIPFFPLAQDHNCQKAYLLSFCPLYSPLPMYKEEWHKQLHNLLSVFSIPFPLKSTLHSHITLFITSDTNATQRQKTWDVVLLYIACMPPCGKQIAVSFLSPKKSFLHQLRKYPCNYMVFINLSFSNQIRAEAAATFVSKLDVEGRQMLC